ncbi:MAG: hydrogenase small subunit [Phycisphaerae bacterium]|nr:hydrogenase small subunit [Phycisphaerae bacterium]
MHISRRDLLKASATVLAAPGLAGRAVAQLQQALAGKSHPPVIWLQGQSCSGCSTSLLNSVYYATADDLLQNVIDLEYHPTLSAAAGELTVSAAEKRRGLGGYILVIEGAIPTGAAGKFCTVWEGKTMQQALVDFAPAARFILAVGTCAAFGGLVSANTNPTAAKSVSGILGDDARIINIPGCPSHPDWIVGTIAHLLKHKQAPPLDANRRPMVFFENRIHDYCERRCKNGDECMAGSLGSDGCLVNLGCRGESTYADCYLRKWNTGQPGRFGVNWCIGSGSPCLGCVNPGFPGMSSFFDSGK